MTTKLNTTNKYAVIGTRQLLFSYLEATGKISNLKREQRTSSVIRRARELGEMRGELIQRGFKNHDIKWLFPGIKVLYSATQEFTDKEQWEVVSKNDSEGWVIIKNEDNLPIKVDDLRRIIILHS